MLATYIIGSLALIVKPGPDLMCMLATALSEGKARALTLMVGLILGCWFWVLMLSAGVSTLFTANRYVMPAVQAVGFAYIAYLAFGAFKEAIAAFKAGAAAMPPSASAKGWRLVRRGVLMAMSNPLTILFFLAFLPSFTRSGSTLPPGVQIFLLGTLFCALVPLVDLPVIFAADFFRSRFINAPKATACLKLASAIMLAAVAAILGAQLFR